jgi:hypothetical protein
MLPLHHAQITPFLGKQEKQIAALSNLAEQEGFGSIHGFRSLQLIDFVVLRKVLVTRKVPFLPIGLTNGRQLECWRWKWDSNP